MDPVAEVVSNVLNPIATPLIFFTSWRSLNPVTLYTCQVVTLTCELVLVCDLVYHILSRELHGVVIVIRYV